MSDSGFVIVCLDPIDQRDRERYARTTAQWLMQEGILAPLARSLWRTSSEYARGEWGPGANWRSVVQEPLPVAWRSSPGEEVDISTDRRVWSAAANSADFTCARCDTPLSEDLGDLVDTWLATNEPSPACSECGWSAPLGDWPTECPPALVGAPAIIFWRWPSFRPDFVEAVAAKLGCSRYRAFWEHI